MVIVLFPRCGENIKALYIEYSENNLRLTRCPKCGHVTDKYIEYELLLVLIDIILHRIPAFRHLLFNRYNRLITTVCSCFRLCSITNCEYELNMFS